MDEQQNWIVWIKKLPTWVSGAIGLATAIITFVVLFQRNYRLSITISGILLLLTMLCLCLYVAFAKTLPLVKGEKGAYRFPKYRPWALAGIGLISILIGATIVFKPSRSFVFTAFIGTPTPTIGSARWIGSGTRCLVLNGEMIEAEEAYARSSSSDEPLSSFIRDTDAAISFDIWPHQEVKINKIYFEVLSYQSLSTTVESCIHPTPEATNPPTIGPPYTIYPGQILPIKDANRFAAPINPKMVGKRFPADLVTDSDEIGFVWLDPGDPESFAVFFATQIPGLYLIRCCDIEFELSPRKELEIKGEWPDQVLLFHEAEILGK